MVRLMALEAVKGPCRTLNQTESGTGANPAFPYGSEKAVAQEEEEAQPLSCAYRSEFISSSSGAWERPDPNSSSFLVPRLNAPAPWSVDVEVLSPKWGGHVLLPVDDTGSARPHSLATFLQRQQAQLTRTAILGALGRGAVLARQGSVAGAARFKMLRVYECTASPFISRLSGFPKFLLPLVISGSSWQHVVVPSGDLPGHWALEQVCTHGPLARARRNLLSLALEHGVLSSRTFPAL
ncbi:hypothetical protein TREES_T100004289 [Tupaia chinensis]|uniref:Uncharacterized protein n=1 Tax=Tupaia chinensis TaxID=246437 RepID=L9KH38_TUPCH|nr:hypothetical protein TREES_T100004289 [Tupaia chinensis]